MAYKLSELIDTESLQRLMELFYTATGIPVGIIDIDGSILVATGWQDICTRFHRVHPVTRERCHQSDSYIKAHLAKGEYVQYKCLNGLWDVGVPIVIADEHVATLFLGQFFYNDEQPDIGFFRRQAMEFGFDAEQYLAALKKIPTFTREKVRRIMDYYTGFVGLLVETGLARLQMVEADRALRESEKKFSRAFRTTPTILIITTLAEGRVIEVNEAFERTLGYERDEAIGRTSIALHIWENPADRELVVEEQRRKGWARDLEFGFRKKNGTIFIGSYSGEVIEINGEACLISTLNDITERKRAEGRIEVLNTDLAARAVELEQANRELEAFNYTVSHDLRSPLSSIHGCSQVILELFADRLDEKCRELVGNIREESNRMNRLIGTLLNFARVAKEELMREEVSLSDIALEVAAELKQREPERRAEITVAGGITAVGDPGLLRVVMENLLGNAWKYTGREESPRIEFGMTAVEGKTACFVRDNGVGFDMHEAGRLFTVFQRLESARGFEGTGIGLATVHRIIARHGGRIWAEGEPGKGASFYFTLPEIAGQGAAAS